MLDVSAQKDHASRPGSDQPGLGKASGAQSDGGHTGSFFRVYHALLQFSLSKALNFRFDTLFRVVMDCVYYTVTIGFFEVLFLHTETLGGWTHRQVFLFLAAEFLLDGIYMTMIARNIWEFPTIINRGELDFYLTRPFPALLMLLLRSFEWSSCLNVAVGAGLLLYALHSYPEPFGLQALAGLIFLLINGFLLLVCIRLYAVLPVFWTHSQHGFHMLFGALEQVGDRPEVLFRGPIRVFFLTAVPIFVVSSFPPRWFFGQLSLAEAGYAVLITCVFLFVTYFVWNRGLKIYTSASS